MDYQDKIDRILFGIANNFLRHQNAIVDVNEDDQTKKVSLELDGMTFEGEFRAGSGAQNFVHEDLDVSDSTREDWITGVKQDLVSNRIYWLTRPNSQFAEIEPELEAAELEAASSF